MKEVVIQAEGIGKRFRIGQQQSYRTVRETLSDAFLAPFRRSRNGSRPDREANIFWALRDVSFTIRQGEAVGVIGPNGAGKSTLLKILSRITEPTTGVVDIRGRLSSLLEVGTGFHSELSGRENIYLNGAILGMRRAEIARKFDEIVAFAEVERFIDTPVKHFSSGMYLRLAFAVAAHLETEILLVDEVLAVGDIRFQRKCLGKMGEVADAGRTVVFVSHNLGALANLCSTALLFSQGRLVANGPSREVLNQYIQSGNERSGVVSWSEEEAAPSSPVVRLCAVRILSKGEITGDVGIDEPVEVQVDFLNRQPGAMLSTSIHLVDNMGGNVLSSANFPSASLSPDEWFGRPYPEGLFRTTCTIPANFLNEGLYGINVVILNQVRRQEILARQVIQFTVHDTGEMRAEWTGKWIGVVRPRLAWRTEHVGQTDESVAPAVETYEEVDR